ncbi:bifunctional 4-hydroxy-2-oxoglutarate aldolase/2-dehydro-3-deoxy-phosphogluconate aldolase [Winogradskyella sp.]|uniref:bifunctional 4-hydroxy-2-oxoglutarate aldolase/2-dehydro-3-deoxy-phosphogluconate aldolase n=1 Tax=Winogradskyella sp. TaxID=1883156 RepID=UPI00260C8B54|nr:bifunctional 4-hydroxy-2-oxoglutarate aldolase/2-dehydro-3-deoxy-phosphogluconate aldolase [Winogradskyella sp.]
MSRFSKKDIIVAMEETGMIPVFNHTDVSIAKKVLDASYEAGIRVFEFTNRGDNALEVFTELTKHAQKYEDLVLGIGTIFHTVSAAAFFEAGAHFIVSPALIPEIAEYAYTNNIIYIPGCGTVTEVFRATQLSCEVIKVFPGNVLGPEFVKATKAVLPHIKIMPTGGVAPTQKNLLAWFNSGVSCVGMGSKLFKVSDFEDDTFASLINKIQDTLMLIKTIRS